MKITLRNGKDMNHFAATNAKGHQILLGNDGFTTGPMEAVLMAIAGCSTIDIVSILKKMRQELLDISVEVDAIRNESYPKVFTTISIKYTLTGNLKDKKVQEAIDLSLQRYCSVSKMIEKSAVITSSFEIIQK